MDSEYKSRLFQKSEEKEEIIFAAAKAIFEYAKIDSKTIVVIGKSIESLIALSFARFLKSKNVDVSIMQLEPLDEVELITSISLCIDMNIPVYEYDKDFNYNEYKNVVESIYHKDEIMDDVIIETINKINKSNLYVISIDINSGLNINNGIANNAIISNLTVCIGYAKTGNFLNDAKDYFHELGVINLKESYDKDTYYAIEKSDLKQIFKTRLYNSHKGSYGYIGVMGGSYKYSGSIKLSNLALSSLIVGGGVSRVIAPTDIVDSVMPYLLESTIYPIDSNDQGGFKYDESQIESAINGLSSLAFGMGIGDSIDNKLVLEYLLNNYERKLLIDADGLNTLSKMDLELINKSKASICLTPHVKEFSRLINVSVDEILNDPIKYVVDFTKKYKCVLVLKGTSTIISYRDKVYLECVGSSALSKGGSGDILSGIIAGIMGYTSVIDAAIAGCYLLGEAGSIASERYGDYATLPRDIISILKEIMKEY